MTTYPPLTESDFDALARMGLPRTSLDLPKENTTMTNQKTLEKHTRHVLMAECYPRNCLEGDCDHRDENGEPWDMTVCPPTPMVVCLDCMVAEGRGADPEHWDDCPLEAWPCSRAVHDPDSSGSAGAAAAGESA